MNEIDKFLKIWKQKAFTFYTNEKIEYKRLMNFISENKKQFGYNSEKTKQAERKKSFFLQDHSKFAQEFFQVGNETWLMERLEKIMQDRKKQLIARVEKKAGKIIDASYMTIGPDGGLNGRIKGEIKTVTVQTIYAGGYNVQCLHYRTLIK